MRATTLDRHCRYEFSENTPNCSFIVKRYSLNGLCCWQQLECVFHNGLLVAFLSP